MANTDNNRRSFMELDHLAVKCLCFANGNECVEPACKRLKSSTFDPLDISPKSIAAVNRTASAPESAPVFKNQKRQRSNAVDETDFCMDLPPARRSSSCLSNPISEHEPNEMFRPRPQYPANFSARIFDSQIGRTADQRAISIDWSRHRTDSDSSAGSPMPTPRSFSLGNLAELHPSPNYNSHTNANTNTNYNTNTNPTARRSIPGLSRSRSRTSSSEWVQVHDYHCDHHDSSLVLAADMEKISLTTGATTSNTTSNTTYSTSPRATLSPLLPAMFTPISMHKVLVLQSTAEAENEEEEEELVETFMHCVRNHNTTFNNNNYNNNNHTTTSRGSGCVQDKDSACECEYQCEYECDYKREVEGEGDDQDGRITMPEPFLLPPLSDEELGMVDGRLSTTDDNCAEAMMFAIEV